VSGKLVAITGATGFFGYHILRAIRDKGYQPIAVVRDVTTAKNKLPGNIEIRQADITDAGELKAAFKGMDAAIHLASMVSINKRDNKDVYHVNVNGAENFLNAAEQAGIKRILFTSTTSAVGALNCNQPDAAYDETSAFNLSCEPVAYIQAKRDAHNLALNARARGAPVVILSPSFVLGPNDINLNTSRLINSIRKKELPICPHGGLNPIDVRDIAQVYVAALEHPNPAAHYILASRNNLTLKTFIEHVATIANVTPPRLSIPTFLALAIATIVETLSPAGALTAAGARIGSYYWYFNAALARRDLSLNCRPLFDTLNDTLTWLIDREKLIIQKNGLEKK
jgi:dihydroflavonol-4-reductase